MSDTISPTYQGQSLLDFLSEHTNDPDETIVVFSYLPQTITLGRLRDEILIRAAFPHIAQTFVQ